MGLDARSGVILCRFANPSPQHTIRLITSALESRGDWDGHFAVIEDDQIRLTPLPIPPEQ